MKTTLAIIVAFIAAGFAFAASPVVTITPTGTTDVLNAAGTYTFTVTNNSTCVGGIRWYNGLHDSGTYVPTTTNRALVVNLKPGINAITIIATNDWATGTVTMVACTNTAYVKRATNPEIFPAGAAACITGTVSQWTWVKVAFGDMVSGTIETNADYVIPIEGGRVTISPLAGDTASILYIASTTGQTYSAASFGPGGVVTIVNTPIHPWVANYLTPFSADGLRVVYIKAAATNSTFQVMDVPKR
jgi:hypothetical protein